jgi:hypothetical protein
MAAGYQMMLRANSAGHPIAVHSEMPPNLLILLGTDFAAYSEYALILFMVPADFDSPMRRFESSRPSQPVTQLEIVSLKT